MSAPGETEWGLAPGILWRLIPLACAATYASIHSLSSPGASLKTWSFHCDAMLIRSLLIMARRRASASLGFCRECQWLLVHLLHIICMDEVMGEHTRTRTHRCTRTHTHTHTPCRSNGHTSCRCTNARKHLATCNPPPQSSNMLWRQMRPGTALKQTPTQRLRTRPRSNVFAGVHLTSICSQGPKANRYNLACDRLWLREELGRRP